MPGEPTIRLKATIAPVPGHEEIYDTEITQTECDVTGCPNAAACKGWCPMHYQRWLRHGDPLVRTRESDEIAVERAVMGERSGRLTTEEREQAVRRLNRIGLTDGKIAERLDVGVSGVWSIRTRLGLPARAAGRRPRDR